MTVENTAVTRKRVYALLYPRAAAVVDRQKRRAHIERHIHNAADLLRLSLAKASSAHGKVLRRAEHEFPADAAVTRNDAVAEYFFLIHAEVGNTRLGKRIDFDEAAAVEKIFHSFASSHFIRRMLFVYSGLSAPHVVSGAFIFKRLYAL